MIRTLIFLTTLSATSALAQLPDLKAPVAVPRNTAQPDTILKVIYADKETKAPKLE